MIFLFTEVEAQRLVSQLEQRPFCKVADLVAKMQYQASNQPPPPAPPVVPVPVAAEPATPVQPPAPPAQPAPAKKAKAR